MTAPDTAPHPRPGSAGTAAGGADRTSADSRAAGATSPRGAQPPGPDRAHAIVCADSTYRCGGFDPDDWEAGSRPLWVDHDGLCMYRQTMGGVPCNCSPSCRCRACVHGTKLAWLLVEIARRFPDGLDRLETLVAA